MPIIFRTIIGLFVSAAVTFFASKLPGILTAFGLSFTVYKGLQIAVDKVIAGVQSSVAAGATITAWGHTINGLGFLGAAGVFDAINIVLSGYVAIASVKATKVILSQLKK
jgi:hypothetical protein